MKRPCSEILLDLPLLLHEELVGEEKRGVMDHLSGCTGCRQAYEALHRTFDLVRATQREPEDFEAFNRTLFQRLREAQPSRSFLLKPWPKRFPSTILVPVVTASLLLLVAGVWLKGVKGGRSAELAVKEIETHLVALAMIEEELPQVDALLEAEAILLDEMTLLAEAEEVSDPLSALLEELEILEGVGEWEGSVSEEELEEELLLSDEQGLG